MINSLATPRTASEEPGVEEYATRPVLSVGLIGCGAITHLAHIPNLAAETRVSVAALSDPRDMARALALQHFPDATAYTDACDLISRPDIDAVIIAAPPAHTAELAVAAFDAGKHVYLEKPGAVTGRKADAVRTAWARAGKVGQVGYNFRQHTALAQAKEHVSAGTIGDIVSMRGVFTWSSGGPMGWRADPQWGGALLDLASHHLDLIRYLTGSHFDHVDALTRSVESPNDTVDLLLRLASGQTASLHASLCQGRNTNALSLYGRTGHIHIDFTLPGPPKVVTGEAPRSRSARLAQRLSAFAAPGLLASGREASFQAAMQGFITACIEGNPGKSDLSGSLEVVDVMDRVRAQVSSAPRRNE